MGDFYKKEVKDIFKELNTTEKGISESEANLRIEKYGKNILEEKKKINPIFLLLGQFNDPVVWVLLGAALISAVLGEYIDFFVILAILVANAIIGFVQEFKAEKAIEALKKMASLKAVILRDGKTVEVDASMLVPGDIVILTAGEKVPADCRLIELNNLQTQEAALTGESLPVKKEITLYDKDLQLGDRKNMVFSGTIITGGKATAIVVKTGMQTEIGKIAKLIDEAEEEETPLQKKLAKLGKYLTYITLVICLIIFGVLYLRTGDMFEALKTSASLAVAAIPEGLPAVVTISLALGVQRMIKKNSLVRRLPSVETLGSTTVICSDKTGTLTKNEMTVRKLYVGNEIVEVTGSGYKTEGNFSKKPKDLELLLKIGLLNNDAQLNKEEGKIIGDPTEGALIVSAAKLGLDHNSLLTKTPKIDEILFDSVRKRMTTIHKDGKKKIAYTKGAPDVILNLCDRIQIDGKIRKLTPKDRKEILAANDSFSKEALRVLGFAYKELGAKESKAQIEKNLIFTGLQGMIDPPRDEVKVAIEKCKTAGIKVIMITGDYMGTAAAIARELGIEGKAVSGEDIDKIDLAKEVENIGVFARVNPEHKMKIVNALKKNGHIVAMTGDGVNDAPALKSADIGISMGIAGTDVAKESSDMILTDDNFASIVSAVEEGRGIFDNIKKFVQYLLSSNLGEILVIFIGSLMFNIVPLQAVQILWMNLVTDGLPAIALGVDPAAKNIMERKPRQAKEGIMSRPFIIKIFYTGALIAAGTLAVFGYSLNVLKVSEAEAQTLAFTTLVLMQFVRLHVIRSEYSLGILSNKSLLLAVGASLGLQLMVVYTGLGKFFETVPLSLADWGFIASVCVALLVISTIVNKLLPKFGVVGD